MWRVEIHDKLQSTQDLLKQNALNGAAGGLVVQALQQSGGQGRHGRVWESPPGNLYLSALLKPECEAVAIGPLSLVVSLALYESLSGVLGTGADIRLKWPNDVLVNDQKIAGILLETDVDDHGRVNWVALGVGVNIAVAPLERSIALGDCLNTVSANNFRDMFLDHLGRLYRQWLCDGFDARLREDWLSKTYKQGQAISVKIGNTLVNGAFHDIDTHGHLRLKEASGVLKTISAGEVFV